MDRSIYFIINYLVRKMDSVKDSPVNLVWTVLAKSANGSSEVVKVVRDYHEADLAVQDNPGIFYKSGPVPIL